MDFDFNDHQTVETLDKVPTDFRGLYTESDGKFVLRSDDDGVKSAISAIGNLNRSLRAARGEAKTLKESQIDLSPLSEFGDSPEKILEKFNSTVEDLKKAAKGKGGIDPSEVETRLKAAREEVKKLADAQLSKAHAERDSLREQLHATLIQSEAAAAMSEHEANVTLAMPHVQARIRIFEEDGKSHLRVVDPSNPEQPRISGNSGTYMTVNELVREMKEQEHFGPLFKSQAPSGGGKNAGSGRGTPKGVPGEDKNSQDKIRDGLRKRAREGSLHFGT